MGEAALVPASPSQPTADAETDGAAERAREDVVFLGGPGVHRDVGQRRASVGIDAGGDDAALPRRLGLDGAQAATAAAAVVPLCVPSPQATSPEGPVPG